MHKFYDNLKKICIHNVHTKLGMLRSAFLGADPITDHRNHKSADTDHRMYGRIIILNVLYLQSSLVHHLKW